MLFAKRRAGRRIAACFTHSASLHSNFRESTPSREFRTAASDPAEDGRHSIPIPIPKSTDRTACSVPNPNQSDVRYAPTAPTRATPPISDLTAPMSPPPSDSTYRLFARTYGQWHIKVSFTSSILQVDRLLSRLNINTNTNANVNTPTLKTEPSCPELRRGALCSDVILNSRNM
jgi:hypothetical protein